MASRCNKLRDERPEHQDQDQATEVENREKGMDKTLADSFPASDPPSTIPDPADEDDSIAA